MDTMTIPQKIEKIIDKREAERLPKIKQKLQFIREILDVVKGLEKFQQELLEQEQLGVNNVLFEQVPQVASTIKDLELTTVLTRIENFKKELERLEKRFSRKCIQIALIGYARKGKSKFLQSVSNLGDDVIPTSSSTDCTGAISVIENYDGPFQMEIEYYSLGEFLDTVSKLLSEILGKKVYLRSLEELETYKNCQEIISSKDNRVKTFYNDYIKHIENYRDCFSESAIRLFTDKTHVIEYVAKYRLMVEGELVPDHYSCYEKEQEGNVTKVLFNKFVAVKSAYIKTKFEYDDARSIVLTDTIGLGNKYTGEADELKMYDVLINDTDAAIFNILIPREGMNAIPKVDSDVLKRVYSKLKRYSPEKWVSLNLNHYGRDSFNSETEFNIYQGTCKSIYENIKDETFGDDDDEKKPLAYCMLIDNNDQDDVRENMLRPVLDIIKDNIDDIDRSFMLQCDDMAKSLYYEYNCICEKIRTALDKIKVSNPNYEITFRQNYKTLQLRHTLKLYVDDLYKKIDIPCWDIINEIKPQINGIMRFVPSQDAIMERMLGMEGEHLDSVYHSFCDDVTAKILSSFKEVSASAISKVKEKVQNDIALILFDKGKLGCLKLKTMSNMEPSIDWLNAFCKEKLNEHKELFSAVKSVINFQMNIEGFLYSKCVMACLTLQSTGIQFPVNYSINEGAEFIWQEIRSSVRALRNKLNEEFGISDEISLFTSDKTADSSMPNLLVWCMANTFMKELINTNDGDCLKDFYSEYATTIWGEEFQLSEKLANATNKVVNLSKELNTYCEQSYFTLI